MTVNELDALTKIMNMSSDNHELKTILDRALGESKIQQVSTLCDVWKILKTYNPAGINFDSSWSEKVNTRNFYTHSIQTLLDVESFKLKSNEDLKVHVTESQKHDVLIHQSKEVVLSILRNLKLEMRADKVIALTLSALEELSIYTTLNGADTDGFEEAALKEVTDEIKKLALVPMVTPYRRLFIHDEFHLFN